jgi:hypothetical protein
MITESEGNEKESKTGNFTIVGKSFGITIGGNQPEDTINSGFVNGLFVPATHMLTPLYVRAVMRKLDADLCELIITGAFTFYHGRPMKAPFSLLRYDVGMSYHAGQPVSSYLNITIRYLSREWMNEDRAIGAMQYIPKMGATASYINSMQVTPHTDGMGMNISIEFVHDNLILSDFMRHKGVIYTHVVEDMSVAPPKSGYAISSHMAGMERGLLTNAQQQEAFNQNMRWWATAFDSTMGVAKDVLSFRYMDAAHRAGNAALSLYTQSRNIGFTSNRHSYQNMIFSLQKQVELSNMVVRTVNVTVIGMPGAWPAELACFASSIANYFFIHWLRLAASGISKYTLYKDKEVYGTYLYEMLKATGLLATDMAALLAKIFIHGAEAQRQALKDDILLMLARELAKQPAYNAALSGLGGAIVHGGVVALPASAATALIGEVFRVVGLEGIAIDSRFDHLTCTYHLSVKAIFSDAMVAGLPMFYNHSLTNALHLSEAWTGNDQLIMTKNKDTKTSIPALQAWIPYPICLGYNNISDKNLKPKALERLGNLAIEDNMNAIINQTKKAFKGLVVHQQFPPKPTVRIADGANGRIHVQVEADDDRSIIYDNAWQNRNYIAHVLAGQTGVTFERLHNNSGAMYKKVQDALNNMNNAGTADALPLSPTASMIWHMYSLG